MHSMNEQTSAYAGMLPYDTMGMYEQPKPRFIFKMPRVVPDQKAKFESDELFRRLSRESDVRYTGFRDRPSEERQLRFRTGCQEGFTEIAFVSTGTNFQLAFKSPSITGSNNQECDFEKEQGKVHLKATFIMNGVCVRFRGRIDLHSLEGSGCLELNEERAAHEDLLLREQIDRYNQRIHEYGTRAS